MISLRFWGPFAVLTLIRLAVAAAAPLAPDEAYYWVWSKALAPGYLDHPPMVALWIRAGTLVAGEGPLGVRLLAPISAFVGTLALARAAEDFLPHRRAGLLAAWLLNATLLFGVGAVTMTPDTPLLFFWTVVLWAMGRLLATEKKGWWLVSGLACGLALCSKYTGVLAPAGIALWVLLVPRGRRWLLCWQSWAGGAAALLAFSPPLLWNAGHHWASFSKQGGRGFVWDPAGALGHIGELIGGQAGLATPLVFALCVGGVAASCQRAWRTGDQADWLLVALTVLPGLVFLQHALGDRVQANWPAIIFPAAAIAAAGLTGWRRLARPAIGLGLAITAVVYLQVLTFFLPLPPRLDPTARLAGWRGFAAKVERARVGNGADFVICASYGEASELARLLPGDAPVVGIEPRWSLFSLPAIGPALASRAGILVQSARRREKPSETDFVSVEPIGALARDRGTVTVEVFRLYRVMLRPGGEPTAVLPRE
jgi:4-amino-4-deoxy-L-arabinose transferase-like glycosyltransferase